MISKTAIFQDPHNTSNARQKLYELVYSVVPLDDQENNDRSGILEWILTAPEIYRLEKPATPPKHLVAYFLLFDPIAQKVLLGDHIKAGLWLPTGGHVEPGEDPRETVRRECMEELRTPADFLFPGPIFLCPNITVGLTPGHIDVNLWFALRGDADQSYWFDPAEFKTIAWIPVGQIPYDQSDPQMKRFMAKLLQKTGS